MKIEEVDKSDLTIKPSKQSIDNALGVPPPFPNKCSVFFVSGGMGTGKSTFIANLFRATGKDKIYRKVFDNVMYATPEEVFNSEDDHIFKGHPKIYHNLSQDTFNKITDLSNETKDEGGNSCLIIDDFSQDLKLKNVEYNLRKLINKHRHLKLNIIISALNQKALSRSLRALVDIVILFKPKSQIETGDFAEEMFALDKADTKQLFSFVFDEPYNFLMYNSRTHTFYKNFNKLIISD